ncbi:cilia- and flagella-associated protein 53-like [Battus philenor]|uniref:cilia- and flagella-associated protein 53-like n=1 Tax=Battus philenor TaxID=42288 RepID=UPI0035CF16CB
MCNQPAPRQKIPKDGPGPRGAPDCYYKNTEHSQGFSEYLHRFKLKEDPSCFCEPGVDQTVVHLVAHWHAFGGLRVDSECRLGSKTSRVLNSTFRYVKFIRKLRAEEEDQRKGAENKAKEAKDKAINDFFLKCDRKSLINDVARRVDLCLVSYQEDLKLKRERLKEIFAREEEENIRKFVEQAQAGAALIWQDKKDRLQYLLAKRKKEHEEKYKDTPLSKCVHVLPCIVKLRAMEAQEIQLYQMKEKQARKMAEKEFDKMWHEVAMKEADALTARMELDAIERLRRDRECKESTDYQIEQRRLQREREKELLKEQTLRFRAIWEEDIKKEEAAQLARKQKNLEVAEDSRKFLEDKQERMAKEAAEQKLVSDAWDSLAGQGLADDLAKIELRKRKERELDECNRKLIELRKQFADLDLDDSLVKEDARRAQEKTDQIRCRYLKWAKDTNKEVRQAMIEQIKDREKAREKLKKRIAEEDEYNRQLRQQLDQLVEHKKMTDAKARKHHQQNLVKQIEYSNLLKERARQEELDQLKKYQIATKEYEEEIKKMLCRPFFSDELHPFMKQMAKGLKMSEKCPCSTKDYCK